MGPRRSPWAGTGRATRWRPGGRLAGGTGDAYERGRGWPDGAAAVAVGGDGTVHEVAAACAGTGRAMGILPVGTGNDYVKALGIGGDLRDRERGSGGRP